MPSPPNRLLDTEGNQTPKLPEDPIAEMAYALIDPIIVFPAGGWEQDIPERLKNELPLRRLAHIKLCLDGKAPWDEATDLEALIYLYPASLAHPMPHEWGRIYLYLGTRVMGQSFPGDIRQESLDDCERELLRGLKQWLHKKKVEARKARDRKGQAVTAQYKQLALL